MEAPAAEAPTAARRPVLVETVDYHTAGEPFRIVTGGVPGPAGASVLERRRFARERLDDVRQLLVNEPRGHADMYGAFVTPPNDEGADLGVVFFHNEGYSTACGHGTIALVTWAVDAGIVRRVEPETTVVVDVPSGRIDCVATVAGGRVRSVRFRNVPSFVLARDVPVDVEGFGRVVVDVAFGGAFYASIDVRSIGLDVSAGSLTRLIALERALRPALEAVLQIDHPEEPELAGVYGAIFFEDEAERDDATVAQRNVTVFADGAVDRSPCGSGTSARLALLADEGRIDVGETLLHVGILGTSFRGRVVAPTTTAGRAAVVTEIEGRAFRTGRHEFVLDPEDPIGTGFLLR